MTFPAVSAQMSNDSRMGTPELISEAKVPVTRARATLWNSGPKTGGFNINRSHFRRPSSVAIHFFSPMTPPMTIAMMTGIQMLVMICENLIRMRVGSGNFPPSDEKRFWNTGTMKMIMALKMITMTLSTTDG